MNETDDITQAPLLSIVTVCRNAADELERTALSVLALRGYNMEYIIIDGASTDHTAEVLATLQQRFSEAGQRVRIVSEPDRGIYDAMSKGIGMARGQWVNFMNAGDTFASPDCLDAFRPILTDNKVDVVYGCVNVIKAFGTMMVKPRSLELLRRKMPFCHQSTLVRTSLMRQHSFNLRYRIVADYDFFYWCYTTGKNFEHVPVVVANFEAEKGTSSNNRLQMLRERGAINGRMKTLVGLMEYAGQAIEVGFNKCYRQLIPRRWLNRVRQYNYQRKEA